MKRNPRFLTLRSVTTLSLLLSLFGGAILTNRVGAASQRLGSRGTPRHSKVAHDLRDRQLQGSGDDKVDVILELNGEMSNELAAMLRSTGVKVKRHFTNFQMHSIQLPVSFVDSLASFPEVEFVSVDSEVKPLGGHVAHTTGADNARSYAPTGSYNGSGVGIAILDSGIYTAHASFMIAGTSTSRILKSVDFTGEARTDDPYGHGTHVAAAAAGNGVVANGKYIGIAPNANIVCIYDGLRVLPHF